MDILANLALGFGVAFTPINLGYAFLGSLVGTLIGVLPGIGPVATIAMLLPITYGLPTVTALIMLAGIYYGASYGGSTTAILVNLPGEMSSVITVIDGHQMARQGRAGAALCIAALGSFFAGTVATTVIAAFAPPLAEVALKFDAAEYFALMVLGLVSAIALAQGSVLKAVLMAILGLLFGIIGTDVNTGTSRFAFNIPELIDGIGFVAMTMGLFAFAEIATNLEKTEGRHVMTAKIDSLWITWKEFKQSFGAILRGSAIGSLLGILPGGGATLSSFASYTVEKKISSDPSRFGKGAIEGVAGPEAANNAGAQTSFIPMLTLGIPSNAVMALMVGALIIHDIQPGPQIMTKTPELFWGLIASMWIGNVMLVILNLPLIGLWVKLLSVPYRLLYPMIVLCCTIGAYSANNNMFDVGVAIAFGIAGYVFVKLGCEPAPFLLGYILGPMLEENLRRALVLSRGDYSVFVTRPISVVMLAIAAVLLVVTVLPAVRKTRDTVFQED
ncbi:tripartite tricarboxylate transporter permease [Xanthobacteraceae bacterium Astr-EGSB]|uniref:tripartite tricarboxylate transporter permease n=1 Tax=Astrobacterium formosum TaxID=3069710 RepID=UPI0027B42BC2|nr:tripartite tricarboxylate transporter permease [Xanthobacteraceae bacterium Astr-EGSB]